MIRRLVMECTCKEFFRRDSRHIFVVSVILNYPWERAQSSLYLTKDGTAIPWWHCMLASLGDGLLVLLMFWAGRVIFGRGSGHVAFGGAFGHEFNRTKGGAEDNIRELHRVYPQLKDAAIEFDWTGPIDCMAEHLPAFGRLKGQPGIFFGVGFNGTGIAQAPVGGRILASLVLGKTDKWSTCGLVGLDRRTPLPPEPIRYLGARVVRHAIRIRNDAEIRNLRPNALVRYLSGLTPGH